MLYSSPEIRRSADWSTLRGRTNALRLAAVSVLCLALVACGGGGGGTPTVNNPPSSANNPPPANPTQPTTPQATAAVQTPTSLSWHIASPLTVVLKDASGNVIPAAQVTCSASNATNLTVAPDCSAITGNRIGAQTIVVSGGGVTADASITVTPQQQALGMHPAGIDVGYSLVVTPDRQILAWGNNMGGVLGQNNDGGVLSGATLPVSVLNSSGNGPLSNIVQVSTGSGAALALTADGQVYEWGSNDDISGARVDGAMSSAT